MEQENKNNRDEQENPSPRRNDNNNDPDGMPRIGVMWIYILIGLGLLGLQMSKMMTGPRKAEWSQFVKWAHEGEVQRFVVINNEEAYLYIVKDSLGAPGDHKDIKIPEKTKFNADPPQYILNIGKPEVAEPKILKLNELLVKEKRPTINIEYDPRTDWFAQSLPYLITILLFLGLWMFIIRRVGGGAGGPGGQIFNIGKSKATLFDNTTKVNITFADVAGLDEAKEEVMEVVDFLKNPKKYTTLGGKIPKGVLLVGPPGTGKTLLAKAVAGEAGAPFFSISGSDFVEMFVGVGASRVRDLFRQAREKAPCIIFIDEIDAIGRARGRGAVQGGNDERENTLNQLLVEMDGFPTDKGVILMAATNRPDILDNALMRPGRFDRQIGIGRPDLNGRAQIFEVHMKNIKTAPEVTAMALSEMTPGFVGADIANVCNEAALIAARRNKKAIELEDFNYALDKVIGGLEKRNKIISPEEKQIIAYHEAGHAVAVRIFLPHHRITRITIIRQGSAFGHVRHYPARESFQGLNTRDEYYNALRVSVAGKAAEMEFCGEQNQTLGVGGDFAAIRSRLNMMALAGMLGPLGGSLSMRIKPDGTFGNLPPEMLTAMEDTYQRMLGETRRALREHSAILKELVVLMLDKEELLAEEVKAFFDQRGLPTPEVSLLYDGEEITLLPPANIES